MAETSSAAQSEVDVNQIATDLNGKADRDLTNLSETGEAKFVKTSCPYVVSRTYDSNKSGIIEIWSDGYCVQTGHSRTLSGNAFAVNLSQAYRDTYYHIQLTVYLGSNDTGSYWARGITPTSTSQFLYYMYLNNAITTNNPGIEWRTEGYIR